MHFVRAKGLLSAANGMNIYRGCLHGCIYCDSRSACYHMEHAFEDVEVKENALELLEDALRRDERGRKVLDALGALRTLVPLLQDADNLRPIIAALAGGSGAGALSPLFGAGKDGGRQQESPAHGGAFGEGLAPVRFAGEEVTGRLAAYFGGE